MKSEIKYFTFLYFWSFLVNSFFSPVMAKQKGQAATTMESHHVPDEGPTNNDESFPVAKDTKDFEVKHSSSEARKRKNAMT